jgi:hypothetical protein
VSPRVKEIAIIPNWPLLTREANDPRSALSATALRGDVYRITGTGAARRAGLRVLRFFVDFFCVADLVGFVVLLRVVWASMDTTAQKASARASALRIFVENFIYTMLWLGTFSVGIHRNAKIAPGQTGTRSGPRVAGTG